MFGFLLLNSEEDPPPIVVFNVMADVAILQLQPQSVTVTTVPSVRSGTIVEAFPYVELVIDVRMFVEGGH